LSSPEPALGSENRKKKIVGVVLALALYLIPTIIAVSKKMPNVGSIIVINVFLGWTFVGWIVALAMACGSAHPKTAQVIIQNNLAHGNMGAPMIQPPMNYSQPKSIGSPVWDEARAAWLRWDQSKDAWQIQSVTGDWHPLVQPTPPQGIPAVLPPPSSSSLQ
jgi:hypothetical protein